MAKAISYKISLLGSEQVVKQFQAVGEAGAQAFAQIQKAAAAAASAAGLTDTADAASSTAAGLEAAGKSAEQAAKGFAVGRREITAFGKALREVGLGNLGRQLGPLAAVGSRLGPLAIGITALGAAMAAIGTAFSGFAKGAEDTAKTLDELAKAGGASFEFLSSLQIAFAQGGTSAQAFAQGISNLQERIAEAADGGAALADSMQRSAQATLSVKDAQLALKEAQLKAKSSTGQLTEWQKKYFEQVRRQLEVRQARLRLERAEQEQREAEANNLEDLVGTFDQISRGVQTTFDPLTKLESKVKAISTLLAGLSSEDQISKLADIFKNLSLVERTQLGKALGLSPEFIESLSRGSEAIRAMQAEVARLGLALNELDRIHLDELRSSQSELGALWDALKNKMGALVAPAFTSFWQGLTERIKELVPQFLELASTFGKIDFTALGRAVGDFALKLANLAVKLGQMFAAAAEGDTSGLTALFKNLGDMIMQSVVSLAKTVGSAFGNALLESIKDAVSTFDLSKEMGKFIDSVLKNWEILKQKLGISSLLDEGQLNAQGIKAGQAFSQGVVTGITSVKFPTAAELLPTILEEFRKFGESVAKNWEILKQKLSGGLIRPAGAAEVGGGQPGGDFGPMIAGAEVAATRIKQIFADAFSPPTTIDFSGIITAAQTAATDIGTAFANIDIASALAPQIDALITKFGELARAAAGVTGALSGSGGGGGGGAPIGEEARGGLIGGRGSGTSDSNLAWVSRGEHIMPARAVARPGVFAFLEALRRSGGNLRGVLDDMGRFARGGLMLPAFAAGGSVGSMSHVTIQFPGLPPISGLRASSSVVDELHRAAALAQVRSGGRKPSRYS